MSATDETGVKALRWSAVLLLFGGIVLAILSGSLGLGALAFGLGAVLLGLERFRVARGAGRAERSIGWVLVLAGAFAMVDAAIRMLSQS